MELRHLRYFIAVAEELHFGRAAEQLGISQPPLSQQIQAMEEELGVRLFERTNRRVALSEVGRLFLPEARQVLAQLEQAVAVARRAQRGELGELKVGFTSSAPFTSTIPRAIRAFRQACPEVHLDLRELSSRGVAEAVHEGRLQVGVLRPLAPLPEELVALELFAEPLVVVLPVGHPLAGGADGVRLAELGEEPFVFFPRSFGTGLYDQLLELARAAGFVPRIVQEASEAMTLIGLVATGLGVTVLPASFSRMRIDGVVCRTLLDPGATTAVWLVRRRDEDSPLVRRFAELLEREAREAQALREATKG
ncbi:LysR family transcriptional regulator [Azotobacter chroococcum]|uniref:Transcriptional regulator, LysR family n=2 Tax=Azotobacter chroococcum TaxID=353 RepID=A0A0C4WJV2_9GAMM|nr:LysR family transcriptional regulator [Azotobacter chroococcum]AJE20171.1 Transcriptional regulator, LysR family [Azotobacter chroococcum NCIMB 8003]ASL25446.1 LysR family transcriptional regulator [Azotobacter chroococcum]QQE89441.1 LysR family transcriptional regulator [Azotobacter chroococcum]TBW03266.1 LysR family transcriptional regulator [Azotobacter chroococcum]TKD40112.1 LysR family transcriptional regulator [Azotobacter chroococcum]